MKIKDELPTIKQLKSKIADLENEVKKLQDENSSLWFMLDEFEKSDIQNPEFKEKFEEVFSNLRFHTLMTHSKLEEA
jgi:SMC interacting uncharacterized protein involved in chromosome segregation